MSDNPFSLLDFLGYFFPGATVLIALYHYLPSVNGMIDMDKNASAIVYVICIIAAYVLGHIVALLSSITVEKYVNWKYGYPSRYLLRSYSRSQYLHDRPMKNSDIGGKRQKRFMHSKGLLKIFVLVLIAPISLGDIVLSALFGIDYYFTRKLPDQQVSMIRAKCINLFKKLNIYTPHKSVFKEDFHRIIHNYYYEKANGHSKRMESSIAIYDFLRAMSFVFVVLFFVVLFKGLKSLDFSMPVDWSCVFFICCYACLSYVCYMGFMKFYRKFTMENFMCLICDMDLNLSDGEIRNDNPTSAVVSVEENENEIIIN